MLIIFLIILLQNWNSRKMKLIHALKGKARLVFMIFMLTALSNSLLVLQESFLQQEISSFSPSPSQNTENMMTSTIFTVVHDGNIFFGNNEDYNLENTFLWIYPSQVISGYNDDQEIYASLFLGYNDNAGNDIDGYPQGGLNELGLCLDANNLPPVELNMNFNLEMPDFNRHFFHQILWECGTVDGVINWFQTHFIGPQITGQLHVADASGDAVVISGGSDMEVAYTRITKNENNSGILVSTNFNVANPNVGEYPCPRYNTTIEMLETYLQYPTITKDNCRDILDAVHQEGEYHTIYSNIFDLKTRSIYFYHHYNFSHELHLNLDTELEKIAQHPISDLEYENGAVFSQFSLTSLFFPDLDGDSQLSPNVRRWITFLMGCLACAGLLGVSIIFGSKHVSEESSAITA